MRTIMPELSRSEKRRLRIWIRRERDAGTRTRMLLLLQVSKGKPVAEVAEALHVARSTVYRLLDRFRVRGWSALADRREENGRTGVDEMFLLQGFSPRLWLVKAHLDAGTALRSDGGMHGLAGEPGDDEPVAQEDRSSAGPAASGAAVPVEKGAENKAFAENRPVDREPGPK